MRLSKPHTFTNILHYISRARLLQKNLPSLVVWGRLTSQIYSKLVWLVARISAEAKVQCQDQYFFRFPSLTIIVGFELFLILWL